MTNQQLDFKINEAWKRFKEKNPWLAHIPEFAEDSEGNFFMRDHRRKVIYRAVDPDSENLVYICNSCNADIEYVTVAHPLHKIHFSESSKSYYEKVPYCPNCEKKPSPNGRPIKKDFSHILIDDIL